MINYRNKFKKYYGINFDSKYEIHHIDFDRNNNDISNLMILPKELHQKYHNFIQSLNFLKVDNKIASFKINEFGDLQRNALLEISDYFAIFNEIYEWRMYKKYLDGLMPNIFNIKID